MSKPVDVAVPELAVTMCDVSVHAAGYVLLIEDYTETNDGKKKTYAPLAFGSQRFTEGQMSLTMYAASPSQCTSPSMNLPTYSESAVMIFSDILTFIYRKNHFYTSQKFAPINRVLVLESTALLLLSYFIIQSKLRIKSLQLAGLRYRCENHLY